MAVKKKMRLLFLTDLIIIWFSIVTAYLFRYNGHIPSDVFAHMLIYSVISCVICAASMIYFQMYSRLWQYASIGELSAICKAVLFGWALSYVVTFLFVDQEPMSVAFRQIQTMLLLMGGVRLAWRVLRMKKSTTDDNRSNVLVVGAGDCGALIAKELMNPTLSDRKLVGFIDDDLGKLGLRVMGFPIIGNRCSIPTAVKAYDVKEIIIAMPSAPKRDFGHYQSLYTDRCQGENHPGDQ
ncbi:nucleoside-diphosphate sugar epimerase/dehydratase [Cohnella kolymensis]|uniref:nucleoside-diphosphate sugar epimerase/dehydratase n=1 Tax=Cohnella kolymensis TaxID=1590652 RepID=UPI000A7C8579